MLILCWRHMPALLPCVSLRQMPLSPRHTPYYFDAAIDAFEAAAHYAATFVIRYASLPVTSIISFADTPAPLLCFRCFVFTTLIFAAEAVTLLRRCAIFRHYLLRFACLLRHC